MFLDTCPSGTYESNGVILTRPDVPHDTTRVVSCPDTHIGQVAFTCTLFIFSLCIRVFHDFPLCT